MVALRPAPLSLDGTNLLARGSGELVPGLALTHQHVWTECR